MAPNPQDVNRANQLNPCHYQYWTSRGHTEDEARDLARSQSKLAQAKAQPSATGAQRAPSATPSRGRDSSRSRGGSRAPSQDPSRSRAPSQPPSTASRTPAKGGILANLPHSPQAVMTYTDTPSYSPLHLTLMIDTSRSMAGDAISSVMDESINVLKVARRMGDKSPHACKASVFHFDTTCKQVIRNMKASHINKERLKEHAVKAAESGQCTALYDSIMEGLQGIKEYHSDSANQIDGRHYFLTVFTDGQDNKSQHKLDDVKQAIQRPGIPNFHFMIISAGLDTQSKLLLDGLVQGRDNLNHFCAGSTASTDLKEVFRKYTIKMEETLTMTIQMTAQRRLNDQSKLKDFANNPLAALEQNSAAGGNRGRAMIEERGTSSRASSRARGTSRPRSVSRPRR